MISNDLGMGLSGRADHRSATQTEKFPEIGKQIEVDFLWRQCSMGLVWVE